MSIYVVNLTEFNDRSLKAAMNDIPENSVILFEDIDCMKTGNRRPESNEWSEKQPSTMVTEKIDPAAGFAVTLSGLLNVLDGFHAPENVVYVMTTNKVEGLDPALLRPGRIDYRLFMGEAVESQRIELYRRFFPEATEGEAREFGQANCTKAMAEFQGLLLALEQGWEVLEPDSFRLDREGRAVKCGSYLAKAKTVVISELGSQTSPLAESLTVLYRSGGVASTLTKSSCWVIAKRTGKNLAITSRLVRACRSSSPL